MPSVEERNQIPASAAEVWSTLRDFGTIDEYVPPIVNADLSSDGVGATGALTLDDGAEVVERLDARNDDTRTLKYSIVDGPLPIQNYEGVLSVTSIDESTCEVAWSSTFEVPDGSGEEMSSVFADLYAAGLTGLKERHAPSSS